MCKNTPLYFIWNGMWFIAFQFPNILAETCTFLMSVPHIGPMAINSGLEWSLMSPRIFFYLKVIQSCDFGIIDDVLLLLLPVGVNKNNYDM